MTFMTGSRLMVIIPVAVILLVLSGCHDKPPKVNYAMGIFPDSVISLDGLNTQFDDYNMDIEASRISSTYPVVFSSNRQSSGGEFDLVHGIIWYIFGQTTGSFMLDSEMNADSFLERLVNTFNTGANEFGPYRFFNSRNGMEYMMAATATESNGLDIVYTSFTPVYTSATVINSPVPVTLFNSSFNDAYFSLSSSLDTGYFCSDRSGDFDIYMLSRPSGMNLDEWLLSEPAAPEAVDSVNSAYDDKCPFVRGRYMVFASEMPGGYGGFDLYYSVFRKGKWSAPVNLGSGINSAGNEYRPVLGTDIRFENKYLIFSSDRSGGKGGYDLYFTGLTFPKD
jgi:hypothetical protein